MMLNILSCDYLSFLYILFSWMSIYVFCFLIGLLVLYLSFESFNIFNINIIQEYTLRVFNICIDTRPFLDMGFANILSRSVNCLLILLTGSFTEQNLVFLKKILMRSTLSVFLFIDHVFGEKSKDSLPSPKVSKIFSYIFFF